jgi:hypothetical protein
MGDPPTRVLSHVTSIAHTFMADDLAGALKGVEEFIADYLMIPETVHIHIDHKMTPELIAIGGYGISKLSPLEGFLVQLSGDVIQDGELYFPETTKEGGTDA